MIYTYVGAINLFTVINLIIWANYISIFNQLIFHQVTALTQKIYTGFKTAVISEDLSGPNTVYKEDDKANEGL